MDERRALAHRVLVGGATLSESCRIAGVTRKTGLKWLRRARTEGLERMEELSRIPLHVPNRTPFEMEQALLKLKAETPEWGAKLLVPLLLTEYGFSMPLRTANRILKRNGLVEPRLAANDEPIRFQREQPMDMLQVDFKGLPPRVNYSALSVIDDTQRFCLAFEPVKDKRAVTVLGVLWDLFADHGLPNEVLTDNGDCFGAINSKGPTYFEAMLMLLGIYTHHGKPGHPQTQGKVEAFHKTVKRELGPRLIQPDIASAKAVYDPFVKRYNWVRPHTALGGKVPGHGYKPSPRKRPDTWPTHQIPTGAITRKVDSEGYISYKGQPFRVGQGLIGQTVVLEQDSIGIQVRFAGFHISYIHELQKS